MRSKGLLRAALSALHYSGADWLIAPFTSGNGVIFMLHHVRPGQPAGFSPNGILQVTPEFLESVILQVKAAGFDCIALDDVPKRLKSPVPARPFAAFTLDDGYRDNRDHAYPVFKRHGVPFTIYVSSDYADGKGDLWWLNLEEALRGLPSVQLDMRGELRSFVLRDDARRTAAFDEIYWWLRALPEPEARAVVLDLSRQAGLDPKAPCRDLVMTWDELRELAVDPLVTIGAHTTRHFALSKLDAQQARSEIADSVARVSAELGKACRHFSYPYGCEGSAAEREFEMARELGLATAVTTRKGLVHTRHQNTLTALPRLSLNGDFQDLRYLKVLLTGVPFALLKAVQRFRRRPSGAAGMAAA